MCVCACTRALGEKQVETKAASDSLTPAADCNSCHMTRRPSLCSSRRSPGEGGGNRGKEELDLRTGVFMNHRCGGGHGATAERKPRQPQKTSSPVLPGCGAAGRKGRDHTAPRTQRNNSSMCY